jgi:hypothetical protein
VLCANVTDIQLHGFSDSSERTYGACLHLRYIDLYGEITCELLCAISKVARIKKTTLPRPELCGALLLAKLYKKANTAHFLIGEPGTTLPSQDLTNMKFNRLSMWHQLQQKVQQFWRRWSLDYLQELQQHSKLHHSTPNLQPGDDMLMMDDNTCPLQWPLATIIAVHQGQDGHIRVITLNTNRETFKRPINKIFPLFPVSSN